MSARAAGLAAQFVAGVIVARALGVTSYGIYATAFAVTGLALLLVGLQVGAQAARADGTFLRGAWPRVWMLGVIGATVTFTVGLLVGGRYMAVYVVLGLWALTNPPLALLAGGAAATGAGRTSRWMLNGTGPLKLTAIGLFVLVARPGPAAIAAIDAAVSGVLLVAGRLALRHVFASRAGRPLPWATILTAGIGLVPAALGALVLARVDVAMLGYLKGPETVARYQLAVRVTDVPYELYAGALVLFIPAVHATADGPALGRLFARVTRGLGWTLLPAAAVLAVFGDVLVRAVYGGDFVASPTVYAVLVAGIVAQVVTGPNGAVLVARARHRALTSIALSLVSFDVLLNLVLIPHLGELGAAISSLLSYLAINTAAARSVLRHLGGVGYQWRHLAALVAGPAAVGLGLWGGRTLAGFGLLAAVLSGAVLLLLGWLRARPFLQDVPTQAPRPSEVETCADPS